MYLSGLQQKNAQRWTQRKRVERGEDYRDGDGDRELLIQPARDAGDKGCRNEYGGQNQGNSDNRAGNFLHGFHRGIVWRQALFHVVLDCLDHDDGVVDHQADGENQAKQGQSVNGKTQHREDDECTDQ